MELNEDAELGSGQVEDLRGGGGGFFGSGGGIPVICLGGGLGNILGSGNKAPDNTSLEQRCARTNPTRFQDVDCRNWLYVTSIQAFWTDALPQYLRQKYEPATTRFFSGAVSTGCGEADSGVGPFYCPADRHVYIDLTFYNELANRFGAKGEFAAPYVLAHEYGHHVQTLLGTDARARQGPQTGPNSGPVRLELQADCYAGVWANHATETKDAKGDPLFKSISAQDIQDAVDTAGAIGDDTIQRRSGGRVNPDRFTHGTAAQRKQWFSIGYDAGDPTRCDTFSRPSL